MLSMLPPQVQPVEWRREGGGGGGEATGHESSHEQGDLPREAGVLLLM